MITIEQDFLRMLYKDTNEKGHTNTYWYLPRMLTFLEPSLVFFLCFCEIKMKDSRV